MPELVGFNWGMHKKNKDMPWEERFNELVAYKEKKGNCNVPVKQGKLGTWVTNQRKLYKKGKLSQEHTTQLKGIGFNWGTQKEREYKPWEERFKELVVYKEEKANCDVPQSQGPLGVWVKTQRTLYKKGKLLEKQVTHLESVGFNWAAPIQEWSNASWQKRFKELVVYKEEKANCDVPQSQGPLGVWVKTQRTLYKKGKLLEKQVTHLESVGFNWAAPIQEWSNASWQKRFKELVVYKEEKANCDGLPGNS